MSEPKPERRWIVYQIDTRNGAILYFTNIKQDGSRQWSTEIKLASVLNHADARLWAAGDPTYQLQEMYQNGAAEGCSG